MTTREVIKRLHADGWRLQRQSASSHKIFMHPTKVGLVLVADHRGDLPIGTLRSIFRQAGWDWNTR
jgi:predicted RNA binding protein YcfA (HicA-like mRNA interferase family)